MARFGGGNGGCGARRLIRVAVVRILAISDAVSPVIYSQNFPHNLPHFDVVFGAGDLPGHLLEFIATKTRTTPVYVIGNHADAYLRPADDPDGPMRLPGGCVNAHRRLLRVGPLLVVGLEGSGRYKPGPHQYSQLSYLLLLLTLTPQLLWARWRYGRAVDVLLTHAAPVGPHAGSDWPHRGIRAFNLFHRLWRPRVHVHGHVHLVGANASRRYRSPEGVEVINAFEFTTFELEVP